MIEAEEHMTVLKERIVSVLKTISKQQKAKKHLAKLVDKMSGAAGEFIVIDVK